MNAILLSTDLMISSHVAGAAMRSGTQVRTASSVAALLEQAAEGQPSLVILDLSMPGIDPTQLVPQLKSLPVPTATIAAFGPHVHAARLEAAAAAGCDVVMSRGQFHAQVDALLARCS